MKPIAAPMAGGMITSTIQVLILYADIHEAAIEGAVHRLRPKLMTVCAVLALIPILWASGIGG